MDKPIDSVVQAYELALRGHQGELHLHLAPDFADGFIDRGEGHDPVVLRGVLEPSEEARLRALALDAFARAGRGEELRCKADLGYPTPHIVDALYAVTGSAHERFHERVGQITRFRRAQGRLKGAASGFGVALGVAIACMAAFPFVAERSDTDLPVFMLGITPLALPWVGLLVPFLHFRALGIILGMGALGKHGGDHFFASTSTRHALGRGTLTAWLAWSGVYAAVVGTVAAVALAVAAQDDWLGGPSTGEAVGAAVLGALTVFGSTALALALTWVMALMVGMFAMTMDPGHDKLFESRTERTALRLITASLPASLVPIVLHDIVYDTSWWPDRTRRDFRIFKYITSDWQTGPVEGTSALLLGGYWLSVVVTLGLLVGGIAFGLLHRVRRRRERESESGLAPDVAHAPVDAPTS